MLELEGALVTTKATKTHPCKTFVGRSSNATMGRGRTYCGIEWDIWLLVDALVAPDSTVLEVGARFGTTSCALSRATRNSGNVVAVEPDASVWPALEANRARHRCNFNIVQGSVGGVPLIIENFNLKRPTSGYSLSTKDMAHKAEKAGGLRPSDFRVPHFQLGDVERFLGRKVDTLVIDCEGCIHNLFQGRRGILDGIKLIILEEDSDGKTDYTKFGALFRSSGFERVWLIADTTGLRAAQSTRYSAWQRGGLQGKPTCEEYLSLNGFGVNELECISH